VESLPWDVARKGGPWAAVGWGESPASAGWGGDDFTPQKCLNQENNPAWDGVRTVNSVGVGRSWRPQYWDR
jgi:hypothetical protein